MEHIHDDFIRAAQAMLDGDTPTVEQLASILQAHYRDGHKTGMAAGLRDGLARGRPFQRGDMGHPDNEMGM